MSWYRICKLSTQQQAAQPNTAWFNENDMSCVDNVTINNEIFRVDHDPSIDQFSVGLNAETRCRLHLKINDEITIVHHS